MPDKDARYFTHDSNARDDPKIICLIEKYGLEGYGRWWVTVEILREQEGYRIAQKFAYPTFSSGWKCTIDEAKSFLIDLVDQFELLKMDDNQRFFSLSLLRRMQKLDELRQKRIEGGHKRAEQRAQLQLSYSSATAQLKDSLSSAQLPTYSPTYLPTKKKRGKKSSLSSQEDIDKSDILVAAAGEPGKPVPVEEPSSLFHAIRAAMLSKNGGAFTDYKREGGATKVIEKRCRAINPEDPASAAQAVIEAFWKLKQGTDKFWPGQPFTPSTLSGVSIWDRVLESMRASTIDPEVEALIKGFDAT